MSGNRDKTLVIYDIDGTIAELGQKVAEDMKDFLGKIKEKVTVALVGGSMLLRISEKLGPDVLERFDYTFAENGLVAYKGTKLLASKNIVDALENDKINQLVNFCLDYLSKLWLPVKRGTFIDFRTGLINVSPAGRFLSKSDRKIWVEYDQKYQVRKTMVAKVKEFVEGWGLEIVIGGQMGFDIFPHGWDKSFCLQYLQGFEKIHFFGDNTEPGGNDYPLFCQKNIIGHAITQGPSQTRQISSELFL